METDYISRAAAIDAISEECKVCGPSGNCPFIMNCLIKQKRKVLRAVPPADVRPVVHCVDCIYDDNCFAQSIFEEMSRIPFDKNMFFCADGKRRGTNMKEEKQ